MKILSIETSCDETAIAILDISGPLEKPQIEVLGNTLISQIDIHKEYGGVFPMLAKREHEKNLPFVLEQTLRAAGMDPKNPSLDLIAVTNGPGLAPALWTGVEFAKALGTQWGIPVLPTNHMEGHIYSPLFHTKESLEFPALALLISGGHTELVLIQDFGEYKIVGKTRDDAVGEAFDKVARLLGLEYPGGPKISKLAEEDRGLHTEPSLIFPRPMIHSKDLDFSYSGLKTSVLYKLNELGDMTPEIQRIVARAFEDAAVDVLISKTRTALELYTPSSLIVAGGVSMNTHVRKEVAALISEFSQTTLFIPEPSLTTDNAVMIGIAAYIKIQKTPGVPEAFIAEGNLSF